MHQRFLIGSEEETKVYLRHLYNSILLKDILQTTKIKDIDILNRILEYMIMNTSQIFSAKSISKYFESINRKVSTETIYNYLEHITISIVFNYEKVARIILFFKTVVS